MQEHAKSTEEWHAQLLRAAKKGDENTLQSLSSIPDINLEDKDGHRAVDYAWESQHFMFVLSLLKSDSAFPLGFHLELESDIAEWKDLKKFVEERNQLHNIVKDGSFDQFQRNCSSIKSRYFLNSENQSLLYTAIKYKKFEISDFLESNGAGFFHKNEKCAADELISKTVNDNLNDFVKYFVKEFEAKLHAYHLILEGEIKKAGKFSDTFSEKIGKGIGAAGGGLIGLALGIPAVGANLGAEGGKEIAEKVGSAIGNEHHRKKVITLQDFINDAENDKANFRKKLVEVGCDIFQSYEMQFMRVSTDQGPKQAMQLLARDATSRIISCYGKGKNIKNLIEGVVSGISKIESVWGMPIPTSKMKKPGFKIYYGFSCKEQWSTASLFQKVGLVIEETYYEKKDGKSRVGKYGCRRLFKSEDWDTLKASWNELDTSDERCRFKNCKYVLNSPDSNITTRITNILQNISDSDGNLMEERIKEIVKEILKEEKNEIIKAINSLKEQSQDFVEYPNILETLEKTLEKLDLLLAAEEKKTTKEPIWFDVREPTDHFSGREKELTDLHDKIHRNPENPTVISQMTSISGLGGIGKTELARQYIKQHGKDFDNVIWINSESEATLNDSFRRLAYNKLNIETKDPHGKEKSMKDVVEDVYTFFGKSKTLLIFDNAEENDDFKNYLPLTRSTPDFKNPYILITSRNREWKKGIEIIHLYELTLEDAVDLIKKGLQIDHENQKQEIETLAEKLQCFPLAMHQAIAYIEDQEVTGEYSISNYLEEYEKKTKDLLESEAFIDFTNDYEKTTFTTWKITIDRIVNDEEHGELASDVLNALAYLAPDNINREMFLILAEGDETKLKSAVRLLVKYSMVNGEQKQAVLNIHRLVQAVIRLQLKSQNKEEKILKDVFELLKENCSWREIGEELDYSAKKMPLLPHLEAFTHHIDEWIKQKPQNEGNAEKDFLVDLLIWMTHEYNDLGDPKKQKELSERALGIIEKHYRSEHFQVVRPMVNLGNAYGDLGDPLMQKELLEKAIEIQEKYYGSKHFQVALTLGNLGNAYGDLGDPQKQKKLLERALEIQEKHYGSDHFQVAITLGNLGRVYGILGDPQRRKELLERALAIQEKYHGSDHFQVSITLVNLGNAYGDLGDSQMQKELLEKALAIQEKHYGSDHFQVAITLVNLGNAYGDLGDTQKRKELLKKANGIFNNYSSVAF